MCFSLQFSLRDADNFEKYEAFLGKVREVVQPLLDNPPPKFEGSMWERLRSAATMKELVSVGVRNREVLVPFYELFTGTFVQPVRGVRRGVS